jgi:hypothetical protein
MSHPADRRGDSGSASVRAWQRLTVAALLAAILLAAASACPAQSGKKNRGRKAAAAAAAQKQRVAEKLQRQLGAARQVLAAAQSSGSLSQQALDEAAQKLSSIRAELEQNRLDAKEAEKTMRAIEAEILTEQPADSEYIRLKMAVDGARHSLEREIRRLLPAADPASLTAAERKTMDTSDAYRQAKLELGIAAKALDRERQKLFQADPQWTAAQKDLYAARQEEARQEQSSVATGVGTLDDKQNLKSAQSLAAAAEAMIALAEARLRRLGVNPSQQRDRESKRSRAKGQ